MLIAWGGLGGMTGIFCYHEIRQRDTFAYGLLADMKLFLLDKQTKELKSCFMIRNGILGGGGMSGYLAVNGSIMIAQVYNAAMFKMLADNLIKRYSSCTNCPENRGSLSKGSLLHSLYRNHSSEKCTST